MVLILSIYTKKENKVYINKDKNNRIIKNNKNNKKTLIQ